jgi:hypothetical protein
MTLFDSTKAKNFWGKEDEDEELMLDEFEVGMGLDSELEELLQESE